MKNILLVLVFVFCPISTMPHQEHAPLAVQCQADKAVWINELSGADVSKLAITEVNSRLWEMANCQEVDPANSGGYIKVATVYLMGIDARYQNFLKRHDLTAQFVREDAEGKR